MPHLVSIQRLLMLLVALALLLIATGERTVHFNGFYLAEFSTEL